MAPLMFWNRATSFDRFDIAVTSLGGKELGDSTLYFVVKSESALNCKIIAVE